MVSLYEPISFASYFTNDIAILKTLWKDGGASASYAGNKNLKVTHKFTNNLGIERQYTTIYVLENPKPPFFPGFDSSGSLKLTTDQSTEAVMPAVTEGTVGPATATVSMSLKLAPFMQLMTQRELAGPLIVKYIFSASVAADALIGETGLFIKITLWDG